MVFGLAFQLWIIPIIYLSKVFPLFLQLRSLLQRNLFATLPLFLSTILNECALNTSHSFWLTVSVSLHIRCDYISHRYGVWYRYTIHRRWLYCLIVWLLVSRAMRRGRNWTQESWVAVHNGFKLQWIMILCDTFYGNVIINNCSGSDAPIPCRLALFLSHSAVIYLFLVHQHICSVFFSSFDASNECTFFPAPARQTVWYGGHLKWFVLHSSRRKWMHFLCDKSQTCSTNKSTHKHTGQSWYFSRMPENGQQQIAGKLCTHTKSQPGESERVKTGTATSHRILNRNKIVWKDSWSKHDTCECYV